MIDRATLTELTEFSPWHICCIASEDYLAQINDSLKQERPDPETTPSGTSSAIGQTRRCPRTVVSVLADARAGLPTDLDVGSKSMLTRECAPSRLLRRSEPPRAAELSDPGGGWVPEIARGGG